MLNNSEMDVLAGTSYAKQFVFSRPNGALIGDSTWGAEFGLVDPDDDRVLLAVATVANSKIAWAAPGVLWFCFPQTETLGWRWERAGWYLDLIMPNQSIDPEGYRQTVLRGTLRCTSRAPSRLEAHQLPVGYCHR